MSQNNILDLSTQNFWNLYKKAKSKRNSFNANADKISIQKEEIKLVNNKYNHLANFASGNLFYQFFSETLEYKVDSFTWELSITQGTGKDPVQDRRTKQQIEELEALKLNVSNLNEFPEYIVSLFYEDDPTKVEEVKFALKSTNFALRLIDPFGNNNYIVLPYWTLNFTSLIQSIRRSHVSVNDANHSDLGKKDKLPYDLKTDFLNLNTITQLTYDRASSVVNEKSLPVFL